MKKPDKRVQKLLRVKRENLRIRRQKKPTRRVTGKRAAKVVYETPKSFWERMKWL